MTSQHYVVETDWQETPMRRAASPHAHERSSSTSPRYDAAALAAAFSLHVRRVPRGLARRVVGSWGVERIDGD